MFERRIFIYFLLHFTMNEYLYHKRRFSNFDERRHCLLNSYRYDIASIDDDNTCSDDDCSRKDMIIR
jgi:hypothetical protein